MAMTFLSWMQKAVTSIEWQKVSRSVDARTTTASPPAGPSKRGDFVKRRFVNRPNVGFAALAALAATLCACGGSVATNPIGAVNQRSKTLPSRPATASWGVEYAEIASAYATTGNGYQLNSGGYCSGGGTGYNCTSQPLPTAAATVPPISESASEGGHNDVARAKVSGAGSIGLGQASANLQAASSTLCDPCIGFRAVANGSQYFTWFDAVIPPRATHKHPKGTPIALTATLSAQSISGSLDCTITNYFVALASAPNAPQLNQPGGCPGQAPGTPLASATWTTAYGAKRFAISGELGVYVDAYYHISSSTFSSILATFHLDPPAGVHYRTASGACYASTGSC